MPRFFIFSLLLWSTSLWSEESPPRAGNDDVKKVMETFKGRGVMRDDSKPTPPADALKTFKMREGYAIDLMAAEPEVVQPLYMSWDSRGRLWVTLYRQYQFPAGLRIVSYDQHLRAVFDKVPEPPPKGVKGEDQVVVFEDTDGDGKFDAHKTVLDGLNIATAAIKGAGGIWVMNTPYLLFYPDANYDDVPDGDPEVRLRGFGLEDTHAVANSLQFGPDGWLYGANGSTTKGNVSSKVTKNVKFEGQHIWRFHPVTHVFEIFGEGGGNTFSTEIDAQGRVFSGTNGSDRGMHYDQGMSGVKNFGKHGPAGNTYAFGYFEHMKTKSDGKRFSQTFSVYDADLMPDLKGRIVAANAMQNMTYVSRRVPTGSTFAIEDDAPLLHSSDRWFRPVDIKVGPDGAIWMADWYDTRLSHVSPVDDWDKTNGRIYRVRPEGAAPALKPFDLHKAPVTELVAKLKDSNKWFRKQAALELGWRKEQSVLPELEVMAKSQDPHAFDALTALHMMGGLNDDLAIDLLKHSDPYIRRWVVRCLGDRGEVSTMVTSALKTLAGSETQPEVRAQLLCSAKRLPAESAFPIARVMMEREADLEDPRIPLLLWWAVENKAESDREAVLTMLSEPAVWKLPLARKFTLATFAKRWALAGGAENFEACAKLLALAPTKDDRGLVIEGIASAFEGGKIPTLPEALAGPLNEFFKGQIDTDLASAVKSGQAEAIKKAVAMLTNKNASTSRRAVLIQALAEAGNTEALPAFLAILSGPGEQGLKKAVLAVAGKYPDKTLAETVIKSYESKFASEKTLKDAANRMLVSRREWANLFLDEVDQWHIKSADVAPDVVSQLLAYKDPGITERAQKHWKPKSDLVTDAQKRAEFERIRSVLKAGGGDADKGKTLFVQRCTVCHKLFGEGGQVGPELTGYERDNVDFWLTGILGPSLEIREGFGAYLAKIKDGQILMGILEKQDAKSIVLRDVAGQRHTANAADIESLEALPTSLMPEGLLTGMSDADLRDLFAYLARSQ